MTFHLFAVTSRLILSMIFKLNNIRLKNMYKAKNKSGISIHFGSITFCMGTGKCGITHSIRYRAKRKRIPCTPKKEKEKQKNPGILEPHKL
jgi:hypothetical protein